MDLLAPLLSSYQLLDEELMYCTSGKFKNQYSLDVILEVQDILNRIEALYDKLEQEDYPGSFRFAND